MLKTKLEFWRGYNAILNSLFDTQGEQGLLTILANPPTKSVCVRGSADPLTLHVIIILLLEIVRQ